MLLGLDDPAMVVSRTLAGTQMDRRQRRDVERGGNRLHNAPVDPRHGDKLKGPAAPSGKRLQRADERTGEGIRKGRYSPERLDG